MSWKARSRSSLAAAARVRKLWRPTSGQHGPALNYAWQFTGKQRMVVSGNEMFGLGALAAGCKLYAAYPMAPSTAVLHWLARHAASHDIVVKQCEDEIAVLNLAVGAAHVGVRAMCATSGGGFSLMTEAVGLAGMTETPV